MTILSEPRLERTVIEHCDELMRKLIAGHTSYRERRAKLEWDPALQRFVHRERMEVWRDMGEVHVDLAADGSIVRFRDEARLSDGRFKRLDPDQLRAVAMTTGLVAADAVIEDVQPGDLYRFRVRQHHLGLPDVIDFAVNPQRRQVAAFEVRP
jgi:hypothetical protein